MKPAAAFMTEQGNLEEVLDRLLQAGGLAALVAEAYPRCRSAVRHTPLVESPWLAATAASDAAPAGVWMKLESEQWTGSFKARGAANKLLSLTPQQLGAGVVTSSTGNHAMGVLHACRYLSKTDYRSTVGAAPAAPAITPQIYVPGTTAPHKLHRLRQAGARIVQVGIDCLEAECAAAEAAARTGATYVSPYNDLQVMAGQGTVGVEIVQDLGQALGLPEACCPDVVLVPVGGGGLIAGIAAVVKALAPSAWVVGCQPVNSPVMARSVAAGRVVELPSLPTLSDGTAGGIEADALTLAPCQELVDEWVLVEEGDIAAAMRGVLENSSKLIEGAAGCAVAACLQLAAEGRLAGKRAVVVVCGGNVSISTLQQILVADSIT